MENTNVNLNLLKKMKTQRSGKYSFEIQITFIINSNFKIKKYEDF